MELNYQNSTGLLAVIGDPIAHSLSPLLQNTMLRELGEDYLYLALRVPGGQVGSFVSAAKTFGLKGFNLTMPHKEDILPYLASMTPQAARCGSVNSVRLVEGNLEGHSTDGLGFRRSIQDLGWDFPQRVVTILGAGGAAKSVAMTALEAGAKEIRVVNRTVSKAQRLCQGEKTMVPLGQEALPAALGDTEILVNTTPVGMTGTAKGTLPDLSPLPQGALCMDCIYAPAHTPFLAQAQALGHPTGNGIGMLVYQAIYALEFFLNTQFSPETVTRLGRLLLTTSGIDPQGRGET